MTWIKLGSYAAIILIGSIFVLAIHKDGRQVERAVCLQKDKDRLEKEAEEKDRLQQGVKQIVDHVRKENSEQHQNTIKVLNERENEIKKINFEYRALQLDTSKRLRFQANTAQCGERMPRKDENTGSHDGASDIELPAKIESGIRELIHELELQLLDCNKLKDVIEPDIEIVGTSKG